MPSFLPTKRRRVSLRSAHVHSLANCLNPPRLVAGLRLSCSLYRHALKNAVHPQFQYTTPCTKHEHICETSGERMRESVLVKICEKRDHLFTARSQCLASKRVIQSSRKNHCILFFAWFSPRKNAVTMKFNTTRYILPRFVPHFAHRLLEMPKQKLFNANQVKETFPKNCLSRSIKNNRSRAVSHVGSVSAARKAVMKNHARVLCFRVRLIVLHSCVWWGQ